MAEGKPQIQGGSEKTPPETRGGFLGALFPKAVRKVGFWFAWPREPSPVISVVFSQRHPVVVTEGPVPCWARDKQAGTCVAFTHRGSVDWKPQCSVQLGLALQPRQQLVLANLTVPALRLTPQG